MHQPGVVVRPLRQMNGYASFNEVFLNGARVHRLNVIGEVGERLDRRARHARARAAHVRRDPGARALAQASGRAIDENRAEIADSDASRTSGTRSARAAST